MRSMRTRSTFIAAFLLAACAARAECAVVTLKDGGILLGRVVGQNANAVELAAPGGTLRIDVDRIQSIDYGTAAFASKPAAPAAKNGRRRQLFSAGFGLLEPVGRINFNSVGGGSADQGDLGAQFGAQYLYYVSPRLGAGLDVDYFDRSGTLSEGLYPAAEASVSGDSWVMLGILRYSLADRGWARPFVLVGAGGARNTETVDVRPSVWSDTSTHETRRLIDDSAWTPAASVRAGVDFNVDAFAPGLLTFEAGWTGLASARYGSTPRGQALGIGGVSGPLSLITITARYGWRF